MQLKLTATKLSLDEMDQLQKVGRALGLSDEDEPVLEGPGTGNEQWVLVFPEDVLGRLLNQVTLGRRRPAGESS